MNRFIKNKKKRKLQFKKCFTKEQRAFIKKYPRLYPVCYCNNVSKRKIDNIFKKINKIRLKCNISKNELENAIRMILVAKESDYVFHKGGRGYYYQTLFEKLDVKF